MSESTAHETNETNTLTEEMRAIELFRSRQVDGMLIYPTSPRIIACAALAIRSAPNRCRPVRPIMSSVTVVESVSFRAAGIALPMCSDMPLAARVREGPPEGPPPEPVVYSQADAGYFAAMGLELEAGRTFGPQDMGENAPRVAVINRTLARRFFGEQNALGQAVEFPNAGPDGTRAVVAGIVGDRRHLHHPRRRLRLPKTQSLQYLCARLRTAARFYRAGLPSKSVTRPALPHSHQLIARV